jgi:hypothetical protein
MAGQEQIYKHHQHRKQHTDTESIIELSTGGPDDSTTELLVDTMQFIDKIGQVLTENCVRVD